MNSAGSDRETRVKQPFHFGETPSFLISSPWLEDQESSVSNVQEMQPDREATTSSNPIDVAKQQSPRNRKKKKTSGAGKK